MNPLLIYDIFDLDCGRKVSLQELFISRSTIGFLEGSNDVIRPIVIKNLPRRIQQQFPNQAYFLKPIPDGDLPVYLVMVSLNSERVGSDSNYDASSLVVCWLLIDIDRNLSEVIAEGIRSVDWNAHAENYMV